MAIRYGSQTVDPVTEVLAPVVGARLDVSRRKVVPVTSFYWLLMADQTDNIQVGTAVTVSCIVMYRPNIDIRYWPDILTNIGPIPSLYIIGVLH